MYYFLKKLKIKKTKKTFSGFFRWVFWGGFLLPILLQGPAGRHGGRHSSHDQHALVRKSSHYSDNYNRLFLYDVVFDASVKCFESHRKVVQLILIGFFQCCGSGSESRFRRAKMTHEKIKKKKS